MYSHELDAWYDMQPRNVLVVMGSIRLASQSCIRGLIQVVAEKSLCFGYLKKKKLGKWLNPT